MSLPPIGAIYRLKGFRNLKVGFHKGGGLFCGIREKFGDRFLSDDEFVRQPWQLEEYLGDIPEGMPMQCGFFDKDGYRDNKALFDFLAQWGLP